MFKSTTFLIFATLSVRVSVLAQKSALLENYERTSICFTFLNSSEEKFGSKLAQKFPTIFVNDKFNDHRIPALQVIANPYSRQYAYYDHSSEVISSLMDLSAPKLMVAKWFSQRPDGSFSMDLIKQRGVYNATDADVIKAKAKKRGLSALQDAGELLLDKTYILAFDYVNTQTWDEFYDQQDLRLVEIAKSTNTVAKKYPRVKYGYKSELICYLIRLNWNESISTYFYENAWNNPSYFNKMTWELKPVQSIHLAQVEGSVVRTGDRPSDDELVQRLLQNGAETALIQFALKYPHFRVRAPLYDVKPFRAKIGLKEDLKIDQRFFVYESSKKNNGEIKMQKKGVLRATHKITDNRNVSTGQTEPSVFYQESGKKLYQGMTMEQMYDAGISFSGGYAQRTLQGPFLRADYNTSHIFNISQLKLFLEAQVGFQNVRFGRSTTNTNITSYSVMVGMSKEYCVLRNIHLEPFAAVQFDSTFINSLRDDVKVKFRTLGIKTGIASVGLAVGLRVPINILHNLQLIPSVSVSSIRFFSNNSLFAETLPNEMGTPFLIDSREFEYRNPIDNSIQSIEGQENNTANFNRNIMKWDISLRYKF